MAFTGFVEVAFTLGLIVMIWLGGAILIKAEDLLELRRAATRRNAREAALRKPGHGPGFQRAARP